MHFPRPQLRIEHIPSAETVVALRFEQIEHETPQLLIGPDDERSSRNINVLVFEPASHRGLMVSLERTFSVSDAIDHELIDRSSSRGTKTIDANAVAGEHAGH